jgi:hypothetical protein
MSSELKVSMSAVLPFSSSPSAHLNARAASCSSLSICRKLENKGLCWSKPSFLPQPVSPTVKHPFACGSPTRASAIATRRHLARCFTGGTRLYTEKAIDQSISNQRRVSGRLRRRGGLSSQTKPTSEAVSAPRTRGSGTSGEREHDRQEKPDVRVKKKTRRAQKREPDRTWSSSRLMMLCSNP